MLALIAADAPARYAHSRAVRSAPSPGEDAERSRSSKRAGSIRTTAILRSPEELAGPSRSAVSRPGSSVCQGACSPAAGGAAGVAGAGVSGPLFLGRDTHALSEPAERSALEVLAANGVEVVVSARGAPVPTPVVSHAILDHNRGRRDRLADGIVVTPSHNPPEDGGIKYNPPDGGPAGTEVTAAIERRANELLLARNREVRRIPFERARAAATVRARDFVLPYVEDLRNAVDLDAARGT